ncbi:hypothetical protein Tco_1362100 [Tanacetum coccineum]
MSNPSTKSSDASPVKIEAPKELPKVSLVNESLKKLKFHLAKFDNVVKIRTTPDARTEGEWGFKHTKAVFKYEIIPFLKSLKDIFNVLDKDLLNEIMEVQTIFDQMDAVVQQSSVDKQCLEIAKKELLLENDRLFQQIIKRNESCDKCFNLDAELLKTQNAHNNLLKSYSQLERHCISLEMSIQLNQEMFQKEESCDNQNDLEIPEYFENNDLKAQLQDKDTTIYKVFVITSLKNDLPKLKGKEIVDIAAQIPSANTIVPGMFKLDLEPLAPRLLQNMEAHIDYLKYTQEQADELLVYVRDTCPNAIKLNAKKVAVTRKNNVKKVRFAEPLTSSSNIKQIESSKTSDSNTPVLSPTGLKYSTSNCGSKSTSNKKNDRISQTPSRNIKNKVKARHRKFNKKNRVVEPIRDVNVKHSLLKANSELSCATCKKSMFDGNHDMCLFDFVKNVNSYAKYAKKHKKTKYLENYGITSANIVPDNKTTSYSVETQKPELKFYSRKPKNVKNVASSKKAKIVESKNANHSEPNHTWGSNAIDIPSSSSLVMTGTVRFGNDHIARIMGYGDYQLGNVTILGVYYVEGLGHNLFSVGQFCDADLEVAFGKNTCFIHNLEVVDLLLGS